MASGKSKYFNSNGTKKGSSSQPKSKRLHSDISNNSLDDPNLQIINELEDIKTKLNEIDSIKQAVNETVKVGDLKVIVRSIVQELMKDAREEFSKRISDLENEHKRKEGYLQDQIDGLTHDKEILKEKLADREKDLREMKTTMTETLIIANEALTRSNRNEQYSRKNNIKIYGMAEQPAEDTESRVTAMLKDVANIALEKEEIIAVHRIPTGKNDGPRPILLKVVNSNVKARIMKKRTVVKRTAAPLRFVDDVTHRNSELIQRLSQHDDIEQSYYFNGSVYGKIVGSDRRIKFDIGDDIVSKIKKGQRRAGPNGSQHS